jgi:hypothetical protein
MKQLPSLRSYCNFELRTPRPGKPHIAVRDGWWRVSPLLRSVRGSTVVSRWLRAHACANALNTGRRVQR